MRRAGKRLLQSMLAVIAILCASSAAAADDAAWDQSLSAAVRAREQGQLRQASEQLQALLAAAPTDAARARAEGELGITALQAHDFAAAHGMLERALAAHAGVARARYALYLGNLALMQRDARLAESRYREALALAPDAAEIAINAALNLARLAPAAERLAALQAVSQRIANAGEPARWLRAELNLGEQARNMAQAGGKPALQLAWRHADSARRLAAEAGDARGEIEALDLLAQIYEDQGRAADALTLTRQGKRRADTAQGVAVADLRIALEWREARLAAAAGDADAALAAYMRAVNLVESVRQDLPIEYEDGRSSFSATLEPLYMGYADLLLRRLDGLPATARQARLARAVEAVELTRQSELQDFLGDRCSVEAIQGAGAHGLPADTAVLYPLMFAGRLELLLKTPAGIELRSVGVDAAKVRKVAVEFAQALRNGLPEYMSRARELDGWLLAPIEKDLQAQHIRSLVVVPDGALRLVPLGALHDGRRFAVERYAVSLVTGLSLTNVGNPAARDKRALVLGMAEPGPVVGKLDATLAGQVLGDVDTAPPSRGLAAKRPMRAVRGLSAGDKLRQMEDLRARLALPGVREEVQALSGILQGRTLLDAQFTLGQFRDEAETGEFRIVHIASHGIFGGSAETSFIMTYDDLLKVNDLQAMLQAEKFQQAPIELLTLSACETAEGNERAPLGISGAAIKARARSVVGTLWPVEDNAAKALMKRFYEGIAQQGLSKTEALRAAQLALLADAELRDPFYWAPFVLIGNWQ
ncbi:MAG: CHAT domain-containing protein [Rhodocyclaceae bacterium]|nr:CHAT domain-containing protein [Rhodocyclaceae bacterium]MBX3669890.1 CHAT domain-containing protein [Rhodocyclaceae bacterium]